MATNDAVDGEIALRRDNIQNTWDNGPVVPDLKRSGKEGMTGETSKYPQEKRACTMALVPNFGPNTAL